MSDENDDIEIVPAEDLDVPDLGPCCSCGRAGPSVRNVVMLTRRAPVAGTGWGCLACGLANDGAVAVCCDACVASGNTPSFVVSGPLGKGGRAELADAPSEPFDHDMQFHPEVTQ